MDAASTTTKLKNISRAAFEHIFKKNVFFIAALALGGLSIIISLLLWAGKPDYRLLYSNMSDKDAGAITAQLTQQQIPYRFDENEGAILVPADAVYETRLKLAQLGLPKGGTVGFELMDKEKFGISQFNEQVNYQRALEGELARTIENLAPINRVRVHLALPKPSLFVRDAKPPSASITLTLFPDSILEASQVTAIAHLISSAVPGLSVDRVTLVDQNGRLLSSKNGLVTQSEQLKLINDIENDYLRRILAILVPIVGVDNVQAQVTAELDFTEQEQTDELYQPNGSDRRKAIRSQQRSFANQGGGMRVGGVPGALSNQAPLPPQALLEPGSAVANSNDKPSLPEGISDPQLSSQDKAYSQRSDETTNFELDKTLIHTRKNRGSITRLSAAVIINYLVDVKGEKVPLDKQRLDEIKALVQEAMGYSSTRGDTLNIANVPFSTASDVQDIAFWQQPHVIDSAMQLCRYLLVFILLWLLWRKAVQPFWAKQHELALAHSGANTQRPERTEEPVEVSPEATLRKQQSEQDRRLRSELAVEQLRTLAEQDPQLIALVMRQWMSKEAKTS